MNARTEPRGETPGSDLGTEMSEPLAMERLVQELQGLPNWTYDADAPAIQRTYQFEDAAAAQRFLSRLDELSREASYQPRTDQDGGEVTLTLSTGGAVTHRDLEYARLVHGLPERQP